MLTGALYLEFTVPRMGRRIDAVVIIGPVIFVLEFKVGERTFSPQDADQVVDYALDLHNFHEGSHDAYIAPVLMYSKPSTSARRRATVDLPAPTGPSIAITGRERVT